MNRRKVTTWVARKEFNELTKDKNCFGNITPGDKPEKMSDAEYMEWIKPLPSKAMVM